jgi:hypothetical protein
MGSKDRAEAARRARIRMEEEVGMDETGGIKGG